ncbi:MAG: hypothetical protein ABW101_08555 [Candidatus Thiodiazotropha sp.]
MKKSYKNLVIGALVLMITSPVMADYGERSEHRERGRDDRIENRIERQYDRIDLNYERHNLSPDERNQVLKNLREIQRLAKRYDKDGRLSGHEYRRLDRKLDENSDLIRELSENDIYRYVIYHDKYAKNGVIKHFQR